MPITSGAVKTKRPVVFKKTLLLFPLGLLQFNWMSDKQSSFSVFEAACWIIIDTKRLVQSVDRRKQDV